MVKAGWKIFLLAVLIGSLPFARAQQSGSPVPTGVSPEGLEMLIKNAIAAVNHANITGNFTVLRELVSERLRQEMTGADLAGTFAGLHGMDLSPILVLKPEFAEPPSEQPRGRLLLRGHFTTRPQWLGFVLIFTRAPKGWMIDDISLALLPPKIEQAEKTENARP